MSAQPVAPHHETRGRPRALIDLTRAEQLLEQMPIIDAATELEVSGRTLERRMVEHPALREAAHRYWAGQKKNRVKKKRVRKQT